MTAAPSSDPARRYLRWIAVRAFLHRGWWLVTSVWFVRDAQLTPLELVALGTGQGIVVVLAEIPAGLLADGRSRRAALVFSQLLMGSAMVATAQVTSFVALAATQMPWGLSWAFASGADVAWITDDLGDDGEAASVIARGAQAALAASALGVGTLGALAALTDRGLVMTLAGSAMVLLAADVARWPERWRPSPGGAGAAASLALRTAFATVRADRVALAALVATLLVNGADEVFGRLQPLRLLALGTPAGLDDTFWLALVAIAVLLVGALAHRVLRAVLARPASAPSIAALACLLGVAGLMVFALASTPVAAVIAVLLVHGVAFSLYRTASVIWLNARVPASARATAQSLLSQAENLGEIVLGFALGVAAQLLSVPTAIVLAAAIVGVAAAVARAAARDTG